APLSRPRHYRVRDSLDRIGDRAAQHLEHLRHRALAHLRAVRAREVVGERVARFAGDRETHAPRPLPYALAVGLRGRVHRELAVLDARRRDAELAVLAAGLAGAVGEVAELLLLGLLELH